MNASNDVSTEATRNLQSFSGRLVLVGAGKMGAALIEGWLASGLDAGRVTVIEPQPSSEITDLSKRGVQLLPDAGAIGKADAIVLAVKPQVAAQAIAPLATAVDDTTLVVSIMAGRTLRFLAECRTRQPRSAAASRLRCRSASASPSTRLPTACSRLLARSSGSTTRR